MRAPNSDARKGKSGGYRIVYQVKPAEEIVLITVYSKSDQSDVPATEIRSIIASHDTAAAKETEEEEERQE